MGKEQESSVDSQKSTIISEEIFNFPNILTIFRVVIVPVMVGAFILPFEYGRQIASSIFIIASITDGLDGFIARNYNQVTRVGTLMDPVADKVIVISALIMLVNDQNSNLFLICVIIMILREVVVSVSREWMATQALKSLDVSVFGKIKTAVQMISIPFLLWFTPGTIYNSLGLIGLYSGMLMSIWSFYRYILKIRQTLLGKVEDINDV